MKNNKSLIIIGIILLNVLVIYMVGQSLLGKEGSYAVKIKEARNYAKQELCSKSINAYNEAISKKDTLDIRLEMIDVYKQGIEIGEFSNIYEIFTSVTSAVDAYRDNAKVYEAACDLFLDYGKYDDCAKILMQARDLNVSSKKIEKYREKVRYQYQKYYSMYQNVLPCFDETYTVNSDGVYSFLNEECSEAVSGNFSYASSFAYGYAFVQTTDVEGKTKSFILNKSGERQVYINEAVSSSGVGQGKDKKGNELLLLSCKVGDTYKYYDINGNELFGDYKFAGRFRNNIAAVQNNDGKWEIIDATGKKIIDKTFSDVILNEFDECSAKGFVFAKDADKYYLYDSSMQRVGDFECDSAKCFADDYTAFKSGDLWGFVDTNGKIVIDAKYEDAKSFSNSLGAVYGGGSWKFINPAGDIIIDDAFEDVGYLSDSGVCFVKTNGVWSYLKFYYTGK